MCTHGRSTGARIVYTVTINTAGEDGSCSRVVLTGGHEHGSTVWLSIDVYVWSGLDVDVDVIQRRAFLPVEDDIHHRRDFDQTVNSSFQSASGDHTSSLSTSPNNARRPAISEISYGTSAKE